MEDGFTDSRILIAGLGLIGGSLAKALHAAGCREIYAFDRDEQTLSDAQAGGVIRAGYTKLQGDIAPFALIVCCLSPAHVIPLYESAAPFIASGGVFAEVGGIKQVMIESLEQTMQPGHALLSLHPMAGSERKGYAHSSADMFTDSVLIRVPGSKPAPQADAWAKRLCEAMGCSGIKTLSAAEHDRIIAHVSHIPHLVALAVKAMDPGSGDERFAGGSFRSVTRVADINAALWAGLFTDNADCLLESLEEFKKQLLRLETAVKAGDAQALEALLRQISKG